MSTTIHNPLLLWPRIGWPPTDDPQAGDDLSVSGVDYGTHQPDCLWREGHWVIVRERGSTQWAGRGYQEYYPTKYRLCRLVTGQYKLAISGHGFRQWELYASAEPGRKWRIAIREMKALVEMLR